MDLTAFVDVAIGLSVLYVGASLFVTVANEFIAQRQNWRARDLAESLKKLIDEPATRDRLKQMPALAPLFDGGAGGSSYVAPNVLASLLVGGLRGAQRGAGAAQQGLTAMQQLVGAIDSLGDSKLKTQLQALAGSVEDDVAAFVAKVTGWVDRSLVMMGEAYKRRIQVMSLLMGLGVAIVFNVDTVALTGHLYRDEAAREATLALALDVAQRTDPQTFAACAAKPPGEAKQDASCAPMLGLMDTVRARNATLGSLPIGWPARPQLGQDCLLTWALRLVGWALTGLAISLGAPFWFDLMNRLVNVRHSMKRPEVEEAKP